MFEQRPRQLRLHQDVLAHGDQARGAIGPALPRFRREAASRLLEGGLALHYVSKLLGHQNIATTSTYLSATSEDLHRAFCAVKNQKAEGERPAPTPAPDAPASVAVN